MLISLARARASGTGTGTGSGTGSGSGTLVTLRILFVPSQPGLPRPLTLVHRPPHAVHVLALATFYLVLACLPACHGSFSTMYIPHGPLLLSIGGSCSVILVVA